MKTTPKDSPIQLKLPIPHHVALIMDGNRRWAEIRKKSYLEGYHQGAETLTKIVRFAASIGVKQLTAYSFSTENWTRPKEEVDILMNLFVYYLEVEEPIMIEEGVRLEVIGHLEKLPLPVQKAFQRVRESTKNGKQITLVIAVNYGGRNELIRGMQKMFGDIEEGLLSKADVNEETFAKYLDTAPFKDPELVIRSSGEFRISNFLPWQISYAEISVVDVLWPDFSEKDFLRSIQDFQTRQRRCGS